jgi:acyl dehydratase
MTTRNAGRTNITGRVVERKVLISAALVARFADLVGDHNPLHVDPAAAAAGRFGAPVAHGMLVGSLFSGMLASRLPGPGTIYLSQSLVFRRPVPVGTRVTVRLRVSSVDAAAGRATIETMILDGAGEICVRGEAVVLLP